MEKVTSADGTTIAYDRLGSGHPLILVGEHCAIGTRSGRWPTSWRTTSTW